MVVGIVIALMTFRPSGKLYGDSEILFLEYLGQVSFEAKIFWDYPTIGEVSYEALLRQSA